MMCINCSQGAARSFLKKKKEHRNGGWIHRSPFGDGEKLASNMADHEISMAMSHLIAVEISL